MSEISDLERRITSALDRIGTAIERSREQDDLSAALEAERTANAQLEERVRAIKEKQETTLSALHSEVEALQAEIASLKSALKERDSGLQRLRRVATELRASNTALREANRAGLPDAHLVNVSMMAELEALRADHAAGQAEMAEIADAIEPLLAEAENG